MSDQIEQWVTELLRLQDEEERMTDKQMKIVQAAVEIFAEKGYSATSTSEIAQKAGVAEGTIFRHYKTKKDLLLSIVAPIMAQLVGPFVLRDFQKVLHLEYDRYEQFLRAMLINRLEFAKRYAPILKIMVLEIPFHPELRTQFREHVASKVIERAERIVTHFQQQGQIIDMPSLSVLRMSGSVLIGYVVTRHFLAPDVDWDDETEIDRMIQFIMHGVAPHPEATV